MKISVTSYSFQQAINKGVITQLDVIEKAKEIGFEAVEFTELKPCDNPTYEQQLEYAHKISDKAKELDMKIISYTIGANLYHDNDEENEKEVQRLCRQLDIAKVLGAPTLRHDVCYSLGKKGSSRSFGLMLPKIVENVRKVTEYAETLGIKTCSENHGYIAQDSIRVEQLFNAVNHENYGLLVDLGNFLCADESPITAVSRVAPYAIHAHCKDMLYSAEKREGYFPTRGGAFLKGAIVGEGIVPVKQCIRALRFAGYDGYISVEYEGSEDCFSGVAKGYANLKKIIAELDNE